MEADASNGETSILSEQTDLRWIELVEDAPVRLSDGRVVDVVADPETDTYVLTVAGELVTPPGLQVREVVSAGDGVLFRASDGDPTEIHLWRWTPREGAQRLSEEPGVHSGAERGEVLVRISATTNAVRSVATVTRSGEHVGTVENVSEVPVVDPRPRFLTLGERELRAALLLPGGREPEEPLPVLMDPYGGPHGARVLKAAGAHLTSQWFADQGFAVLVVDGRGVDGRGPAWDREMYRDFTVALEDQVDALHAAAERFGFLDLGRVGIRGWSFGGELAAMALLRRPDVFHAGVVGAPVTDQHLYDTFYTERYLGLPQDEPEVYRRNSPLFDAASLSRPMLLIHGLADDNVFVANTLRLLGGAVRGGQVARAGADPERHAPHALDRGDREHPASAARLPAADGGRLEASAGTAPAAAHLVSSPISISVSADRASGASASHPMQLDGRSPARSGDGRPLGDDRVVLVLRTHLGRSAG